MRGYLTFSLVLFYFLISSSKAEVQSRFENISAEAIAEAKKEQKFIFAVISAPACPPCRIMEKTVYTDPTFSETVNKMLIPIMSKGETVPSKKDKISHLVTVLPTILILNEFGEEVDRVEGGQKLEQMTDFVNRNLSRTCTSIDQTLLEVSSNPSRKICCEGLAHKQTDKGIKCVSSSDPDAIVKTCVGENELINFRSENPAERTCCEGLRPSKNDNMAPYCQKICILGKERYKGKPLKTNECCMPDYIKKISVTFDGYIVNCTNPELSNELNQNSRIKAKANPVTDKDNIKKLNVNEN